MDDKQNMDILVTYQIYLTKQMDMLFSVLAAIGLNTTNDLRMRATIKAMDDKYKYNHSEFLTSLEAIISPDTQGDIAGAKEAAESEMSNGKISKATDEGGLPETKKPKK
jgi:hypothetical protein